MFYKAVCNPHHLIPWPPHNNTHVTLIINNCFHTLSCSLSLCRCSSSSFSQKHSSLIIWLCKFFVSLKTQFNDQLHWKVSQGYLGSHYALLLCVSLTPRTYSYLCTSNYLHMYLFSSVRTRDSFIHLGIPG